MVTTLVLIFVITLLVLIHEFGHYFVAKKTGVRVEEFGIGLPPRAIGKKVGETIYSINWLPFGGFVKLTGEDFDESDDPVPADDPRNFKSKTPLQKTAILIAGVFMNIVFAVLIYFLMFFITNFKTMSTPLFFDYNFKFGQVEQTSTVVSGFAKDSPAEAVGVDTGEAIIEINDNPVYDANGVKSYLADKEGQEVSVLLMDVRGLKRDFRTVKLTPMTNDDGEVLFGVYLTDAFRIDYSNSKVWAGLEHTYNMGAYSVVTLGKLIGQSIKSKDISPVSQNISGPVGISHAVSGILTFSGIEQVVGLLDLMGLLSISLAVLNIFPLPALDGGRLLFILIGAARGKKVSPKLEAYVHKFGMLVLLALLVLITIKDVKSLF